MRAEQIFENVEVLQWVGEAREAEVSNLSCNTQKLSEGCAYFCLSGSNVDGHDFAQEAVCGGAKLIVCERTLNADVPQIVVKDARAAMARAAGNFYGNPRDKLKLIGVTGTNGKTTTTYMLQSVLKSAGFKVGVIGTIGIVYGDVTSPAQLTTPDPIELHKIFAQMVSLGVQAVVMEVSAHAIFLNKMAGITCDVGILTNVTQDHIDFFKTFENYANTKRRFITPEFCKCGVVNVDDELGREIAVQWEREPDSNFSVATYGLNEPGNVFAVDYEFGLTGTKYLLNVFDEVAEVNTKLIGKFNLYNALSAAAACKMLGIGMESIVKGLNEMDFVPGRFNVINLNNGATAVIDYAHTPDGLYNILSAVRGVTSGKVVSVFGCGGNRDALKRPIMGEISATLADFTVITSDNPRFEEPEAIIREIEKGVEPITENYLTVVDREHAVEYALKMLKPGDVAVISGKGVENYIDIKGVKRPYSDTDAVMRAQNKLCMSEKLGKEDI